MKKLFIPFLFIGLSIYACNSGDAGTDKRSQLETLKKQQAELKEKILKLEAELEESQPGKADEKSKLIAVTEMQAAPFSHYIEVQAKVEGDEDVLLSAETMGNVTAVMVKAGDRVQKGQVLATIDDRVIRQSIAEVQSQLDLATIVYNRQKNLWDQKIGSEIQFLQAKTNKEALDKRMATMQEQLNMTRIKSPIIGTVDDVHIKVGQTVSPGIPTLRVVNLNALKVTAEIAESHISKVNRGNEVILYFPDMNKEIRSRLDYAGQAINALNRTFNAEVRLRQQDGTFHPNMVAIMKIVDYTNQKAFSVPVAAVQKSAEGEFVYVAGEENGKLIARRKTVSTGVVYNGIAEIKSGLEAGDKVVTTGFQNIIDGDRIRL